MMLALAGTALVPAIKGAHNWIALGPIRVQPSEFYKIASLLMVALLIATRFNVQQNRDALSLQPLVSFRPAYCQRRPWLSADLWPDDIRHAGGSRNVAEVIRRFGSYGCCRGCCSGSLIA